MQLVGPKIPFLKRENIFLGSPWVPAQALSPGQNSCPRYAE